MCVRVALQVRRYASADAFLADTLSWLSKAEIENSVMLSLARSIADGTRVLEEPAYFAAATDGAQFECCALRTPPWVMLVTRGTARGLSALAADAREAFGSLPGVTGPAEAAAAYAGAWVALAGGHAKIDMRQRLHSLQSVSNDLPTTPGTLREVSAGERALAIEWTRAFELEAIPNHPHGAASVVDRHLRAGTLYFWDIDHPVAMCANAGGTGSSARINLVYTPAGLRGHGYATAAVAALTRRLLGAGRRSCCLNTDLSNPTSNSIYRRIGYRPLCDFDLYRFAGQ